MARNVILMNENEPYEFAEFISYLRNMNNLFNLDDIMKGIKTFKEKRKNKY